MPESRPEGIPGSVFAGPFPVGVYAARLRDRLRDFAKVQVFGEVVGFRVARTRVFFELRDGSGALPCSMWRTDWEALRMAPLADGVQVVAEGGCDFYPGSRQSSPSFSFAVERVSLAGEGDLLAQLAVLRRRLHGEGLFEPQKRLARPALPRTIGVVTGESGKARDDVLAGLARRGWQGRIVWAFAPVQDRHAAGAVARALQDLAASGLVDVIVVARGGGSLMDLFAFCDETLCRTVSMLPVPVIASVGHHTDRTLIDDVAAVSCSTPTHAAEAAVPVHCGEARAALHGVGARLDRHGRRALAGRARLAEVAGRLRRHRERALAGRDRLAELVERLARHGAQAPAVGTPLVDRAARLERHGAQALAAGPPLADRAARLERHGAQALAAGPPLADRAARLERLGRRAVVARARELYALSRAPAVHLERERARLHQTLREIRASGGRVLAVRRRDAATRAVVVGRKAAAGGGEVSRARARAVGASESVSRASAEALARRRETLDAVLRTLEAHDPQRTLERGYALVEGPDGTPVVSADAARSLDRMTVRLHDGSVDVRRDR